MVLEMVAANLPLIALFVIGIALLIIEAIMPGFGAPGITGIVLEVITLVWVWFEHGPLATLAALLIVLLVLAIAISTSLRSMKSGRMSRSALVNSDRETNEDGYRSTEDMQVFLGKSGVAKSVLRPTGIADFEGVRLNVSSEGEYIPAGTKVQIIKIEGAKILVKTT